MSFYGGEALLEIERIKACADYIKEAYKGKVVRYTITTNGTAGRMQSREKITKKQITINFCVYPTAKRWGGYACFKPSFDSLSFAT